MLALSVPRKPAPMLAMRGAMATKCLRPTAFGNALGESIKDQMVYGGSQQTEALGAVYNDGDISRSELRAGEPYAPDFETLSAFEGAFGDGSLAQRGSGEDILLAAGPGYTGLGNTPAPRWSQEGEIDIDTWGRRFVVKDGRMVPMVELEPVVITGRSAASQAADMGRIQDDFRRFEIEQMNADAAAAQEASLLAEDGMRIGPTIERARALNTYSGDVPSSVGGSPGAYMSAYDPAADRERQASLQRTGTTIGLLIGGVTTGWAAGARMAGASDAVVNDLAVAEFGVTTPLAAALAARGTVTATLPGRVNPLSPVLEFDARGNEVMYRTMQPEQFEQLRETGKLPPTTETSMSPSLNYAAGKYTERGGVTVKLTTAPGTSAQLQEIGIAANEAAAAQLPNLSTQTGTWMQTNARFKVEGGQMTTQLGQGRALEIFNKNLIDFELVPPKRK